MNWQDIAAIIGAISGVGAIFGLIWMMAIWKGRVDSDREEWKRNRDEYPPAELWMMCKTMWEIFVVGTLQNRTDLATRQSPYKLTRKGKDLIPDAMRKRLDRISAPATCQEDVFSGWLVIKHLGVDSIADMAKENGISVQEAAAILSTYLNERFSNNHTGR